MSTSFKHSRFYFKQGRALRSRRLCRGFTLIELLVVCGIVVIITSFVLFQQSKFNSATLLRSLSYSVALSVRQAQVYGTSVRGFTSPTGGGVQFASGYGVQFSTSVVCPSGTPLSCYYLFADLNNNGALDDGSGAASDERLPVYRISNGYSIKKFCATLISGGSTICSGAGLTSLGVYFRRPNTEACFTSDVSPGACAVGASPVYSSAYIQMQSSGNTDTRSINITLTGQISICTLNADPAVSC